MTTNGRMRILLTSGAIVLVDTAEQLTALPQGTAFEPTSEHDPDGRAIYREVDASRSTTIWTLTEELKAAASALERAAYIIRESGVGPLKASETHQAAQRAAQAVKDHEDA